MKLRTNMSIKSKCIVLLGVMIGLSGCVPPGRPAPLAATAVTATALPAPPTLTASPTAAPTKTAVANATAIATVAPAAPTVFQIDPTQSEARFTINEALFGDPKTVVGLTSDISGVITFTTGNPAGSQIGTIQINARSLHTDEEMRDRAIRTFILESSQDDNQFITFEPTAIEGLPAQTKVGEATVFKVTGNLKIRSVIKPVTFELSVTPKGDTELSGSARATITRTAFELTIPSVPGVADVTDEVALDFTFVAKKV